ncbi:MgtC/SapB family protein [Enterobacter sp. JMULE2]|uniref:MgtC/SapB family protein n=1 Tax=Enterobacter sp. JMULE2 TaxID=2518340 RepID=UPI001576F093|nr:MgtC/SapB family protein [Enterobacter sp. JMULE2]NTZ38316.1 MgtC/SapB family protein [Enterobacter sp. JMULE2]
MRLILPAAETLLLPFTSGQIATCLLCGFAVGLERQLRGKPIGIRTSTLIVLGSYCFLAMPGAVTADAADRARVLGQLITGVGFLGVGVMMTRDGIVTGATSAATVWMMAATGAMTGLGLDRQALIMTGLVVGILAGVDYLERKVLSLQKGVHRRHEKTTLPRQGS